MSYTPRRNYFRIALDRMMEARARQAAHYVNGALLMLDDETLKHHGIDRDTLRKRGPSIYPF